MHPTSSLILVAVLFGASPIFAADPAPAPAKPPLKIIPGQVIVPIDAMRRIWGELVSLDLKTRTGVFRKEPNNEIMKFTVMPYAELLHHADFGDLPDYRIGTRGIFRLHENDAGEWVLLTYIVDEMTFLDHHKEYYYVDRLEPETGKIECTDANGDKSFVREKGIILETDGKTLYWKAGQPAKFSDIQVGDKLRTETHGIGKGKVRMCWNICLDEESLQKFKAEQKALESKRIVAEGAPGYIDQLADRELKLTLFQESGEVTHHLKPGEHVRVAPAGVDRKPTGAAVTGVVAAPVQYVGPVGKVTLTLDAPSTDFHPPGLARLWETP